MDHVAAMFGLWLGCEVVGLGLASARLGVGFSIVGEGAVLNQKTQKKLGKHVGEG